MHKTPALGAGVLDHFGGDPGIPSTTRKTLKANKRAKAQLRCLRRLEPYGRASR